MLLVGVAKVDEVELEVVGSLDGVAVVDGGAFTVLCVFALLAVCMGCWCRRFLKRPLLSIPKRCINSLRCCC